MKCFVTGCAGFIGSNLVDRLLLDSYSVIGFDNFSTGKEQFLQSALENDKFKLIEGDLLNLQGLTDVMAGDIVFHLAANADISLGIHHPHKDIQQNTIGTFNVLEAMRLNGIKRIVFSSTSSVYGESSIFPTPENAPFPIQTSLYGASKVAGEALISAYCEGFGLQAHIFRFVPIVGERYTHGHIVDFYYQLLNNPNELHVLGNGRQKKSYLYIQDCIDAIFVALEKSNDKINIFNLGSCGYIELTDSVNIICKELGVNPRILYGRGDRGWVGDNKFMFLDIEKIKKLGWFPKFTTEQAIINTIKYLDKIYDIKR
jgi:UDP-glucose 4-epimerase